MLPVLPPVMHPQPVITPSNYSLVGCYHFITPVLIPSIGFVSLHRSEAGEAEGG